MVKMKLLSFTIIELVITMLIGAIVTSFAYYSYSIFQSQFNTFRDRSSKIGEYRNFSTALHFDFEKAEWVRDTIDQQHIVLGFQDTLIFYTIRPDRIFRQVRLPIRGAMDNDLVTEQMQARWLTDSFPFRGYIKSSRKVDDTLLLVNEIEIVLGFNKTEFTLTEDKLYSAQQLIKATK